MKKYKTVVYIDTEIADPIFKEAFYDTVEKAWQYIYETVYYNTELIKLVKCSFNEAKSFFLFKHSSSGKRIFIKVKAVDTDIANV